MPFADFCTAVREPRGSLSPPRTRCRSPEVSLTAFPAHLPNLQPRPWWKGLCGYGPARPAGIASYSVSVRQVAGLLPRFFQTAPRGNRPCASLALCPTRPRQRTFTSKLSNMLGTPGAVDAKNASTAPWKTAQNAVSHSYHRPSSLFTKCHPCSRLTLLPMFPVAHRVRSRDKGNKTVRGHG